MAAAMNNVAAAAAAVTAARAAKLAAVQQAVVEEAERLRQEFGDEIQARRLRSQPRPVMVNKSSLSLDVKKYLMTSDGRDLLHQAAQKAEPIDKLLPWTLQYDLMMSAETQDLRTSVRGLRALVSPTSRALSVVLPLRNMRTVTEFQQELEDIYQLVVGTCKDTLQAIYLESTEPIDSEQRNALQVTVDHHVPVLREFVHRLLTAVENITVFEVVHVDHLVTDETLGILASRHKNLRFYRQKVADSLSPLLTAGGVRTLTSGCSQLQVLDFNAYHRAYPDSLSPEAVVSTLQNLRSLRSLDIEQEAKLEGMMRYAKNHANPPHPVEYVFQLCADKEDLWGGENFEHFLTTFPNHENVNISPITDRYSDAMGSRSHSLNCVTFDALGGMWSVPAQDRFFRKFTTLTVVDLSSHSRLQSSEAVSWGPVDLRAIGQNCLSIQYLSIEYADFIFKELDTMCFKHLALLRLLAPPNRVLLIPDSTLKCLLSGPQLYYVYFIHVDMPDRVLLELSQQAKEQRGGVFASLRYMSLRGLSRPGLQAATVVSVACQAPKLNFLRLSVRVELGGGEEHIRDHPILSKFFAVSAMYPKVEYQERLD